MICDLCGEDVDEKGIMLQLPEGIKQICCVNCFINQDLSDKIDVLFYWGISPDFIKIINDRNGELIQLYINEVKQLIERS